jgi:hypothetical protein
MDRELLSKALISMNMTDTFKIRFGESLPEYRFKPGECIVTSAVAEQFRRGRITQKHLEGLKMLVAEVGIDKRRNRESYRLLFYSTIRAEKNEIERWFLKEFVEPNYELCDHPEI